MTQYYLQYEFTLEEPLIISDGTQIGNVLQTRDYIPGSTILGTCAGLYLRHKNAVGDDGEYSDEFHNLFLSEKTIFSPAYPLGPEQEKTFPMPLSVFGCKYYGTNTPEEEQHGFRDYLKQQFPDQYQCPVPNCGAPLEHKRGYAYEHREHGYCNFDVKKEIISHNKVSDETDEKRLFSFEAIAEGQMFYGEIAFSHEEHREIIFKLLKENDRLKLGKARNRGYGAICFSGRIWKADSSFRNEMRNPQLSEEKVFSVYLFSDTILADRSLNHCSCLDEEQLVFWMNIGAEKDCPEKQGITPATDPAKVLKVYKTCENGYKSFWKNEQVLGFNQHRRMPLPAEISIAKGSAFTVLYSGNEDISPKLRHLQDHGLGLRRNEGFGQVVVCHAIHSSIREEP